MKKKIAIVVSLVAIIVACFVRVNKQSEVTFVDTPTYSTSNAQIMVQIKGEVNKPGIYKMTKGCRVQDLIDLAGGFTNYAKKESINLVKTLSDSDCIIVEKNQTTSSSKVNINTASLDELMGLYGIGEKKAQAIIEYRENSGGFKSINELLSISGITQSVFNRIINDITI